MNNFETAQIFSFSEAKKKKELFQSQKSFEKYLKLLKNEELETEVHFYLENFPASSQLTPSYAFRGKMILEELALRIDDSLIKASINSMANDLQSVIKKIS